jgi:hypothetical protein
VALAKLQHVFAVTKRTPLNLVYHRHFATFVGELLNLGGRVVANADIFG